MFFVKFAENFQGDQLAKVCTGRIYGLMGLKRLFSEKLKPVDEQTVDNRDILMIP